MQHNSEPKKDDITYLTLLIQNIQAQLEHTASKDSVEAVSRRVDELNVEMKKRFDNLSDVQIASIRQQQQKIAEKQIEEEHASLRKIVTIQASILVSSLTVIVGLVLNFIFKFLK